MLQPIVDRTGSNPVPLGLVSRALEFVILPEIVFGLFSVLCTIPVIHMRPFIQCKDIVKETFSFDFATLLGN